MRLQLQGRVAREVKQKCCNAIPRRHIVRDSFAPKNLAENAEGEAILRINLSGFQKWRICAVILPGNQFCCQFLSCTGFCPKAFLLFLDMKFCNVRNNFAVKRKGDKLPFEHKH